MNLINLALSTSIGGMIGYYLAFIINAVLIEISINAFFNIYYGTMFILLGFFLIFRIN